MASSLKIRLTTKAPAKTKLTGLAVAKDFEDTEGLPTAELDARGFKAAQNSTAIVSIDGEAKCLIGLGSQAEGDQTDPVNWVNVGAAFSKAAKNVEAAAFEAKELKAEQLADLVLGLHLGGYFFDEYKENKAKLKTVAVLASTKAANKEAVARAEVLAEAIIWAREMVDFPGGELTPQKFADASKKAIDASKTTVKIWGMPEIKKAKLGGLLGVNRGSDLPARLVEVIYKGGGKDAPTVALVGKGLTYDAGGLSIKSAVGMSTMKCDMGGAAAVLGAMVAIAKLHPKVNVHAWVPMTDNMLGGDAMRGGDVLVARNKKTIEVLNTDAEGRLALADALSLASEAQPDAIIDLATLTGAALVALGGDYAPYMANNEELAAQLEEAASEAKELIWRLPLVKAYRKQLDSNIADMKNIGGPKGGTITAGLFLQEFVGEGIPWAHIDIAGPAFAEAPTELGPKGGTGFAVRTLVELIENFKKIEA